jgi:GTP-binding protein
MHIKETTFVMSSSHYKQAPIPDKPEIAFIGRSNVGKSSLINMLLNNRNLAKTSSKPGKTRLINHFLVNKQFYLVDLPGYGWAKVSKTEKERWNQMVNGYLLHRSNLTVLLVLIDSRLPPQAIDLIFMQWLINAKIHFAVVLSKADKLSRQQIQVSKHIFSQMFIQHKKPDYKEPPIFITSAKKKLGKIDLLQYMEVCLQNKVLLQPNIGAGEERAVDKQLKLVDSK